MYILIIARGYPSKIYKTYGIFEFEQARALQKTGCKVVYAAVDVRSIRRWRKWGVEHFKKDEVEIYGINIPCGSIPNFIRLKISSIALEMIYKLIIKKHGKPDIMHAHFSDLGLIAAVLKNKSGVPLVLTEHSSMLLTDSSSNKYESMAKQAYACADMVVAVSPYLRNVIKDKFKIKAAYIPNMVDTDSFYYEPKKKKKDFKFVSVGNLISGKRMDFIIEAFYRAFKGSRDKYLTIIGEGKEKKQLYSLIENYKLQKQIKMLGLCSKNIIAQIFRDSDCFILASRYETFGVAYVEALACGLPVIATRCGGPESFVTEKNGLLVPIDDLDALVEAIIDIHKNIGNYDQEQIALETRVQFSPESLSNKLIKLYKEITSRG